MQNMFPVHRGILLADAFAWKLQMQAKQDTQWEMIMEELDQEHIELLLRTQIVGRLGCYADQKVYVVPISYAYHDGYLYGHTNDGMKLKMVRKNPNVCVEVDDVKNYENWRSVIAWGKFEELSGHQAAEAISILVGRLAASLAVDKDIANKNVDMGDIQNAMKMDARKGVIYRIVLSEKTGRYEEGSYIHRAS